MHRARCQFAAHIFAAININEQWCIQFFYILVYNNQVVFRLILTLPITHSHIRAHTSPCILILNRIRLEFKSKSTWICLKIYINLVYARLTDVAKLNSLIYNSNGMICNFNGMIRNFHWIIRNFHWIINGILNNFNGIINGIIPNITIGRAKKQYFIDIQHIIWMQIGILDYG